MKKIILIAFVMMFTLGASMAFAAKEENNKITSPGKTENKLSDEEINRLTRRVEEIRDMDKTSLSNKERRELKKELKVIKKEVGGTVYIGVGTLLLLVILAILLL